MKETQKQKTSRAQEILRRLKREYGTEIGPFIDFSNPLELIMGTILSAQCTDERVNAVTKVLFQKYKTAADYKNASLADIERIIHSTGFFRQKAKSLKETGRIIDEDFDGRVPDKVEDLLTLRGVSYKTAHLITAKAYGVNTGIAVDTHVDRLARLLNLSQAKDPTKKSRELATLYPKKNYLDVNEYFIVHGRAICVARRPQCAQCVLADICPSSGQ